MERTIHHGKNVARFRQMLQIKQDALASMLGEDWDQVKISRLEAKEIIDDALLKQISEALKIPSEAIKQFNEEQALNVISNNTFENCAQPASIFYNSTINPIDKLVEVMEENKRLYEELLKAKDEQIELLKKR